MSHGPFTDEWRKSPSGKRRPAMRERHDDLKVEPGQVWRHKPDGWLYREDRTIYVEITRIARRSVFGTVVRGGVFNGFKRQITFLELRGKWERA